MNTPNLTIYIALILSLLGTTAFAQQTVSGKVVDEIDGVGLPGVNILEKGTSNGTVTDFDGNYTLQVGSDAVLVFSFVGYASQEVVVGSQSVVNVQMAADVKQLSEIVVVGYGQQEAKDVTGVVAKVSEENFNKGVVVSADNLIAGKIPGVNVTSNSGEPGGQTSVRIRGGTSINASNEPLYVIDGVPLDNTAINPGGLTAGRNPLNFLNPNDIADVTVLKDASAAAIYGSRAANGVILITTKKGETGEGKLAYSGWVSVSNAVNKNDVLTGPEFRSALEQFSPSNLELIGNANTDWQAQVLTEAFSTGHDLSYSGGTEKFNYRGSLGYLSQEGILRGSETERISYSLNLGQELLKGDLQVDLSLKGARTEDIFPPNVIGDANSFAPTQPIFDANSPFGGFFEWQQDLATDNPVANLNLYDETGVSFRNIGNINFDYAIPVDVLDGFSVKLNMGFDIWNGRRERFQPLTKRSQQSTETPQASNLSEVNVANFTRENLVFDFFGTYERELPEIDSKFDLTGGYSWQDFSSQFPEYRIARIPVVGFGSAQPGIGDPSTVELGNNFEDNRLVSYFVRLNYGFKDRYLLTVNYRRDGSSRFGPENQFGNFPSVALGWRISDEPFFSGLTSVFDNLKFRFGWGINGQQDGIGNFGFLPTGGLSRSDASAVIGGQTISGLRFSSFDEFLKWEETEQINIGLDFGFFDGRLNGSVEYYNKETTDLLFETTAAALSNAQDFVTTNIGSVENRGVEINLNGDVFSTDDLTWNLNFNVAYNKNEITKLDDDPNNTGLPVGGIAGGVGQTISRHVVGEEAFSFFTFQHIRDENGFPLTDGVDWNEDGSIDNLDIYVDQNGDGQISEDDRIINQSPFPDWTLGLTSNTYYKNFDLSFTIRTSIGNRVYNNVLSTTGNLSGLRAATPSNIHRDALLYQFDDPQLFSDVYIEDATFLRMDNITLGYQVPKFSDDINIRVYSTIQNLFVITGYSGLDPEVGDQSNGVGLRAFGIDNNIFPRARTFLFGINVDF
jgi:iron complex outermembrane receptor protein